MSDNREEVAYQYTGDVSSLRDATQEAINLLDKYGKAMHRLASMDTFKASKTSTVAFQRTVAGLVQQVNSLTTSLNVAGSSIEQTMPDGTVAVQAATRDLADVLSYLDASTSYTSEDMKFLTEVLKGTRASMDSLVSRVSLLTGTLKPLEQIRAAEPISQVSDTAKQSANNISSLTRQIIEAREMYKQCGKSAEESALSILKFESASIRISNVSSLVKKLGTEMQIFGIQSKRAWSNFEAHMKPMVARLQSFKDTASQTFGRFNTLLASARSALRRTVQTSDDASDSASTLNAEIQQLSNTFRKSNATFVSGNQHFRSFSKIARTLKTTLTGLIGVDVSKWLVNATNFSINYIENLNLFKVAMGDCVEEGTAFVNKMSEIYGLDPSNLLRYAGNFYQLADAISMPDRAASNLSLGLTKAAVDISSLFNVDVETVFKDLSSGMQGMSRAVRKYGMDIRATTLQQTALSLGITETTDSMSEANLQGLRFITMMRQAANASGDFKDTIEEPANQLRIFKEQMTQLGRSIGNLFIVPIGKAIQYINGFIMALRMAIDFIAGMLGVLNTTESSSEALDGASEGVDKIGTSANNTTKALKAMLAPFDELNILQSSQTSDNALSGIGALDPSIEAAIAEMQWKLEEVRMKAHQVRDDLLKFFGFTIDADKIISWDSSDFEANLIEKFPQWESAISGLFDLLTKFKTLVAENVDLIPKFLIGLVGLKIGFEGLQVVTSLIGPISDFVATCGSALGTVAAVIAVIAVVIADIAILYANSETFAASFRELLGTLGTELKTIGLSILALLSTIWSSIQKLWRKHIKPTLKRMGEALAPVLKVLGSLFRIVSTIIQDLVSILDSSWTSTIEPVFIAFTDAVETLIEIFDILWYNCLEPILSYTGESVLHLWNQYLSPVVEKIISVVGGLRLLLLNLWNTVLAPIVKYNAEVLGPVITTVFTGIWTIVEFVISSISTAIDTLLGVLDGVIQFLNGVFSGDWESAFEGLGNIFVSFANGIIGTFEIMCNVGVGAINTLLEAVVGGVKGLLNGVGDLIEGLSDFLGFEVDLNVNWEIPKVPQVTLSRIPQFESGGMPRSGQLFMARENGLPELVGGFGGSTGVMNNQQIVEAVAQGVYEAVMSALNESENSDDRETVVECDGEALFRVIARRNRRAILRTGVNFLGGES